MVPKDRKIKLTRKLGNIKTLDVWLLGETYCNKKCGEENENKTKEKGTQNNEKIGNPKKFLSFQVENNKTTSASSNLESLRKINRKGKEIVGQKSKERKKAK